MKTRRMNRWDSMLAWLAQAPENKWSNVKTSGQRLSTIEYPDREWSPLWHAMEWAGVLIRLGHAEFDPASNTVAACSPGLLRDRFSSKAILYGYWNQSRLASLREIGTRRFLHRPARGPTCRAIVDTDSNSEEIARSLDVWLADETSVPMLRRLPRFSILLADLPPSQKSPDGYWEQFDYISDLHWRWRTAKQPLAEPGLYRRKEGQTAYVFVASDHRQFSLKSMDEKLAAKWACYTPRFDWMFDAERNVLLVPYGTPDLPVLVSRGLTMKSARLPVRMSFARRWWWKYVLVNERQAIEAARVMEQVLTMRRLADV